MGDDRAKWLLEDRVHSYVTVATATCLVFDHLTTFADEVSGIDLETPRPLLCQSSLSNTKTLLRKAIPPTIGPDNPVYLVLGYLVMVPLFAMQGIMICRISSMWNHNQRVIILLSASFSAQVIAAVVMKIAVDRMSLPIPDPVPGIHICLKAPQAKWLYLIVVPFAIFELLLLITSISRGIQHYYRSQTQIKWSFFGHRSLIKILFRDSITFPFIELIFSKVLLVFNASQFILGQLTLDISIFWPGVAGPRLILNLREAYYQPFEQECNVVHNDIGQFGNIRSVELFQ
ncbi:hypothetical protein JR316_0003985 [Psilocybe cubensis]|uniref:Uncharacterized protein n=1 Tax=Psilocybe cubensis TaxID=181762 RepID=A0ACB8H922_PSICU|nr:hypothetical protein JR316_0003985 [Psilocybe cubensis]KAH9484503.1 hypothetical protein JR316_0003985 [Psilocybe cubensis]